MHWGRCQRRNGVWLQGRQRRPRLVGRCPGLLEPLRQVFEADALIALALGHDAVVESDAGSTSTLLMYFERGCGLVAEVQPLGVVIGSQEHVIRSGPSSETRRGCSCGVPENRRPSGTGRE